MTQTNKIVLPAEWAPQSAVMLTWPHENTAWRPWLADVERVLGEMSREIARREIVLIVANSERHRSHIEQILSKSETILDNVKFAIAPSDDSWARDHGPISIFENGNPVLLDFTFNGWGNKFSAQQDNQITHNISLQNAFGKHPVRRVDFVMEGGSIESDGAGTLLTTSRCLLSKERNPQLERTDIENYLRQTLGVTRILWLEHGYLAGDDTDSHIDTLARLCDASTIAYVRCDDPNDEHFKELKAMESELRALRTSQGLPYRLVDLPWPRARFSDDGERLPATYANFLIVNDAVLVPTYDDPKDAVALEQVRKCFPDREIIGIDCLPIIRQYGSLHCLTMQIPTNIVTL